MAIEVLSPVGSSESLVAAVRAGADAVYLGAKSFSARRNATNFDNQELVDSINYCHIYGVKVYITVNILIKQEELNDVIGLVQYLNDIGVDGLIVQDLGLCKIIHDHFPDLPLHGSTQMSIHHESALPFLKQLGFSRIVVAREMSREELRSFCIAAKEVGIEVEYFVHGALCMCVSGQCLLSAMIGQRSGNRGLCAQPCRLPFSVKNGTGNDLSLKDSSLFKYVKEMKEMGVTSLKIEGRMKRPEYVALATHCCKQAVEKEIVEDKLLRDVFSRSGFTDGYYTLNLGKDMFGIRTKEDVEASKDSFNQIHEYYRVERANVEIKMFISIHENQPIVLKVGDVVVTGEAPLLATNKPTTKQEVVDNLKKLGNTAYYCNDVIVDMDDGLFVRNSIINNLRRELVEALNQKRSIVPIRQSSEVIISNDAPKQNLKDLYIRIANKEQLPSDLSGIKGVIYPLDIQFEKMSCERIVEIPRWIYNEKAIKAFLQTHKELGVKKAYCNNISACMIAKEMGFEIMGGNFLNVSNGKSFETLSLLGIQQVTLSAELTLKEMDLIHVQQEKGIISYGYIPLMIYRNCPLKNGRTCDKCDKKGYIKDRMDTKFPIRCRFNMSELLNATPIYLADKQDDLKNLTYQILYFTIEEKANVENVIASYQQHEKRLTDYTRGLYYRGVL